MSQAVLCQVLERLDAPSLHREGPVFSADEVSKWPRGALEQLVQLGILQESAHAKSVYCDGCEEACLEEVIWADSGESSPARAYIVCRRRDDIGRVPVLTERLRSWQISLSALADRVRLLLDTGPVLEEIVEERLWYLGHVYLNERRTDFLLFRGAAWPDSRLLLNREGRLQECANPVILIPSEIPDNPPLLAPGKVLSLVRLLSLTIEGLKLDRGEIEGVLGRSRARRSQLVAPFQVPEGTCWEQVSIEFVNEDVVRIAVGGNVDHRDFAQMGFADKRKSEERPDRLWTVFLGLAKSEGKIGWGDSVDLPDGNRDKLKKWVSDIRTRLKAVFPQIPEDPFKPYRRVNAYETRFRLITK